tara:strand:- start:8115 stop:8846 length:732 start_codon:yes stop_codon:yes gene_type:complete
MNKEEQIQYERDGFVILKNVISKSDCINLLKKSINPVLRKNNIYYTGKRYRKNKTGTAFWGKNGHPIHKKNKRWPALFNNKRLNSVIGEMHPHLKWKWVYGAEEGLGWIHIRYPYTRNKEWTVPKHGWHLDGTTDDDKPWYNQSITILPLINSITPNGGGTAIIPGSHKLINYWIHHLQNRISLNDYIQKNVDIENSKNNIIESNGDQGDILIMHPHMIHAPSNCYKKNKIRITFNLSTGYGN